jgi:hypothetical protein
MTSWSTSLSDDGWPSDTVQLVDWGTRQRSRLRHYATSRKVTGSIYEVIGFFNWPNPSSRTMALVSTQSLTEMSTRNLPGGKGRLVRKANNLTVICEPTVYKIWEPRRLTTLWASTACYTDSFNFTFIDASLLPPLRVCAPCIMSRHYTRWEVIFFWSCYSIHFGASTRRNLSTISCLQSLN